MPSRAAGRQFGPTQGAVADDAGAQQRCEFLVGVRGELLLGQRVGEGGGNGDVLRVPAVGVPAGVTGVRAEVLPTAAAVDAHATGVPQPRHADPSTFAGGFAGVHGHVVAGCHDLPHDFVARDYRRLVRWKVAVTHVEVGTTHAARADPDQDLVGSWAWYRHLDRVEAAGSRDDPRPHRAG